MVAASSSTATTTTEQQQPPALLLTADTWWNVVPGLKEDGVTPLLERCKRLLNGDDDYTTDVCAAYREFLECKAFVRDWDNANKLSPSIPVDQMWHQHILDSKNYPKDCKLLFGRIIHHNPDGDMDAHARSIRIASTKALLLARNGPEILQNRVWDFGIVAAAAPTENSNIVLMAGRGGGGPLAAAAAAAAAESQLQSPRRTRAASPSLPHDTTERNVRTRHDHPAEKEEEEEGNNNNGERITLRVRNQTGEETFFTIKKTTKLEYLSNMYAKSKGICPDNLSFMLYGEKLLPHETPLLVKNLNDQDRLDVLDVMFRIEEGNNNNDPITLRVRDQTGKETFFKIKKTIKMGKVFETFAQRKGVCAENLRFMLDGERLYSYQTPLLLKMDDQDLIDCMLETAGC